MTSFCSTQTPIQLEEFAERIKALGEEVERLSHEIAALVGTGATPTMVCYWLAFL